MNEIEKNIKDWIDSGEYIRAEWYAFITNKQYPLQTRWRTFLFAPSLWKRDDDDSDCPLTIARQHFDSPYDHFRIDRHQTIYIDRMIDRLKTLAERDDNDFTEDDLHACMEEAMLELIGSWTWDW